MFQAARLRLSRFFVEWMFFVKTSNCKSKDNRRSFDYGTYDKAVSAFAQDDNLGSKGLVLDRSKGYVPKLELLAWRAIGLPLPICTAITDTSVARPMGMVAYSVTMRVSVLYFAVLKDVFGRELEELELPAGATVRAVVEQLRVRCGALAAERVWDSLAVAVNQEYARLDMVLQDGDEVAMLPPVSGGCWA